MQKEKSSRPTLWATVLSDLRKRLAAGDFADRFPTDRELMAHYEVSRHTVREAVRRLDAVDRRPRRGGRVRPAPTALSALIKTLGAIGVRTTSSMTDGPARVTSAETAAAFGLDAATPFLVSTAVLLADDRPIAALETWHPVSADLPDDLPERILREDVGVEAVPLTEHTTPVAPDADVCKLLGLPVGRAVFCLEALLRVEGADTVWQRAFVRPDRYPCLLQFARN
ncbi:GntR family transcriptional regulator [Streptomyces sp. ODS05-4]|uniref:GntR family transcriptional regulator n=1 Tax=Streptomyces sp. ODS05-4 TaxID=2944939 RepID=UPI0021086F49|nr:GntR family transcriptional regulator [Streptomyces sp. ODS05-4]